MNNATKEIIATYDKETMEEIADHGCQSGVCSQHIYYGDTIKFFDKYEDEIMDHFTEAGNGYGDTEFLIDMFKDADACLNIYKNNMTWAFIESVAFQVTEDALEAVEENDFEYSQNIAPVDTNMYHTEDGELVYN